LPTKIVADAMIEQRVLLRQMVANNRAIQPV
jgi:hypothetical protein